MDNTTVSHGIDYSKNVECIFQTYLELKKKRLMQKYDSDKLVKGAPF